MALWSATRRARSRLPLVLSRAFISKPGRPVRSPKTLDKVAKAAEEWRQQAKEIRAGDRKHVLDVLDERGFVKQFVG